MEVTEDDNLKVLNIPLDKGLHKALKLHVAYLDIPMTELIRNLIEAELTRQNQKSEVGNEV